VVGLRYELWSPDVGYPYLNGAQALFAQTPAMRAYPISCSWHATTLHVTTSIDNGQRSADRSSYGHRPDDRLQAVPHGSSDRKYWRAGGISCALPSYPFG